jgi:hypothetical protein
MSTLSPEPHDPSPGIMLIKAAAVGDFDSAKALIAAGVDVNSCTEHGMTALMNAAAKGHLGLVNHLLRSGADINAKRYDGLNALSLAVFFGHPDVVRELLSRGADATGKSRFGSSLEAWASARGLPEIAWILTEARSDKAVQRSEKSSAPAAQLISVQEPPLNEASVIDKGVSEAQHSAPKVSRITVKTLSDSTDRDEGMGPIESSRLADESPARVRNIAYETYKENLLIRWLSYITADWQRLAAITVVVMLVCGLCTFAVLQLLTPNTQTVERAVVSESATHGSMRFDAQRKNVDSTTRGEGISSSHQKGDTSGELSKSSIDSRKTRSKSAVVSSAQPAENRNNSRIGKSPSRKSNESVTVLPARPSRIEWPETRRSSKVAPKIDSASGPATNSQSQVASGMVVEQSSVRTPPAAPPVILNKEMQLPRPSTTGITPASTTMPKTRPKEIRWP